MANSTPVQVNIGGGLSTVFGTLIPPGSKVSFVSNSPTDWADFPDISARILPTLAAGCAQCRSGKNDFVFVLPNHSENVTTATGLSASLVAGTQIIGVGDPKCSNAPTFSWTNTAGSWAISVANVSIQNLRLLMDGANGITKAINITAAGVSLLGNYMRWASGAALKSAIAIEVGSGATDCTISGNRIRGTATHNVTNGILLTGATVPSRFVMENNDGIASATAANGLVNVSVAALGILIRNNDLLNEMTSSTSCITVGNVAATGIIANNNVGTINDGTGTAQGVVLGAGALVRCFNNQGNDEPLKGSLQTPAAST